jgi:5-methyltetrahydropteroyltriglutamate--homocysteine methyltransferase
MTRRLKTTHVGSLPRPKELLALLLDDAARTDRTAFDNECRQATNDAVKKQLEIGLDIVNDGEMSKTGFVDYVRDRIDGISGESVPRWHNLEDREFYSEDERKLTPRVMLHACDGPLKWCDFSLVERDIATLKQAIGTSVEPHHVFMSSIAPGLFVNHHPNRYYPTRDAYLSASVDLLKREYEAIAAAGFVVQLDSPDLAQRSNNFPDTPLAEWRNIVASHIEAANAATANIPQARVRVHVCWGNYAGPHNHDTELNEIIDLLLKLRCGALSVVGANGRHEHEWRLWKDHKLPDGMSLIPGVIDSTTSIVEHPDTVAERLMRYASVAGASNIIAGADCGFGTLASNQTTHPNVVWAKLSALVKGAAKASERLWLQPD